MQFFQFLAKNVQKMAKNQNFQNPLFEVVDIHIICLQKIRITFMSPKFGPEIEIIRITVLNLGMFFRIFPYKLLTFCAFLLVDANFETSLLGNGKRFFNSVKSSWYSITQIMQYMFKGKKNKVKILTLHPPPIPLKLISAKSDSLKIRVRAWLNWLIIPIYPAPGAPRGGGGEAGYSDLHTYARSTFRGW